MDEEEKPFPIEFIVILLIIAVANDIAEIFFDLLDFTGVGIAGEAIMEPVNLVLDFFFTGIFWWKVGLGGGTITQYIGDLLEPFFIPGRTISVSLGLWIANNPNSALGKAVTTAASIESGNIEGVAGEAEGAVGAVEKEAAGVEKKIQAEGGSTVGTSGTGEPEAVKEGSIGESKSPENQSDKEKEDSAKNDIFKNPYDNPVGTAAKELNEPPEEEFHEGKGFNPAGEPQKDEFEPKSGIHIVSRRSPSPDKKDSKKEVTDIRPPENLKKAA